MPIPEPCSAELPDAGDVRCALDRMLATDAFRASPQLAAFLRYVVEAKLRGEADRIKGYTIAVEALGRADDFDPQADPIVRVEAMRLRRAINRYYADAGDRETVIIELPLGSYVPVFRRNAVALPLAPPPASLLGAPKPAGWHSLFGRTAAGWRRAIPAVGLVLLGGALFGALDFWLDSRAASPQEVPLPPAAQTRVVQEVSRPAPPYPVVFVGAFQTAGNGVPAPSAEKLRAKLRDALARFDEIHVRAEPPKQQGYYQLTANAEYDAAGMTGLMVRLTDTGDDSIVYTQTFDRDAGGVQRYGVRDEDSIIREVLATLARPYGIIHARERARMESLDDRYRCLHEGFEYWRDFDPKQGRKARDCLERVIEANPRFSLGYAALAALLAEETRTGVTPGPESAASLQRALRAARRAVELKPASARAHQALARVQFVLGDYRQAIEAGERAFALNPYDPNIVSSFGANLMATGEVERGARLVRQVADTIVVRPAALDFYLFLSDYLENNRAAAARYAAMITSDTYPLGLLARALVAAQAGRDAEARDLVKRLIVLQPAWKNCRTELGKYFPADAIADRLDRDLRQIVQVPGQ